MKRKKSKPSGKGWLIFRLNGALALFGETQFLTIDPSLADVIRAGIEEMIRKVKEKK